MANGTENEVEKVDSSDNLNELFNHSKALKNRVTRVGTSTPVDDFKFLVDKLCDPSDGKIKELDDFEDLCLQIQTLIRDLFCESLVHKSDPSVLKVFQEKISNCICVLREYCSKLNQPDVFNMYIKAFKKYLLNEPGADR